MAQYERAKVNRKSTPHPYLQCAYPVVLNITDPVCNLVTQPFHQVSIGSSALSTELDSPSRGDGYRSCPQGADNMVEY